MKKIRKMLRQALTSTLSPNAIAAQRGMSHNTVRRAVARARIVGLTIEQLDTLDDRALRALLRRTVEHNERLVEPDWSDEIIQMRKHRLTREIMHARYSVRVSADLAMAYRTYCDHMKRYERETSKTMRLEHEPGWAIQTDYAGDRQMARSSTNGASHAFEMFVAVLPASGLIAAAITPSQNALDHAQGNIEAFKQFGGVAEILTPDNLKAAIIRRLPGGGFILNPVYEQLVDHYGCGVIPARPRRPQDKGSVEAAVKLVQRDLRRALAEKPMPTRTKLKQMLAEVVAVINDKPSKALGGRSRRNVFETEERARLKPLPKHPFVYMEPIGERRIGPDYHVDFAHNRYSVPHRFTGKTALVRASATKVEIRVDGLVVAVHPRSVGKAVVSTDAAHRTPEHAAYSDDDLESWATRHGVEAAQLVTAELARPTPPQNRPSRARWIMALPRRYGRPRFQRACARAVALNDLRFEHVENVLKRSIENAALPDADTTPHLPTSNVRGADYYREPQS